MKNGIHKPEALKRHQAAAGAPEGGIQACPGLKPGETSALSAPCCRRQGRGIGCLDPKESCFKSMDREIRDKERILSAWDMFLPAL